MRLQTHTVRTGLLTGIFALALAASVAAAPQRGGHVGGGGHARAVAPHSWDRGPHGPVGGPRHIVGPRGRIIVGGGFYDPFWGPYYPYGFGYAYPWAYGYPYWGSDTTNVGSVKTEVTPKNTEVYVDGYFAGTADDFNGAFQRLHAAVGGHAITLHLDGYRTVTQNLYVRPDSTVKLKETMEKLAPGEVSQPVTSSAPQTRPSEGAMPLPDSGSAPRN